MSKVYAVKVGRVPGIYKSWSQCKAQCDGFSGASYKSFTCQESAMKWMIPDEPIQIHDSKFCLYVDGGHNKVTGKDAWARCVDGKGKDMIKKHSDLLQDMNIIDVLLPVGQSNVIVCSFNDVSSQQNNGAELVSMVTALRIASTCEKYKTIFSDSLTVVNYWSISGPSAACAIKMDPLKKEYCKDSIKLRKAFEKRGGQIVHISGDDNIADLGYHR